MTSLVNIIIDNEKWLSLKDKSFWEENFNNILKKISFEKLGEHKDAEVNLLLTNDQGVMELNREFRNKNSPTNVLSFPQHDDPCKIDTISDVDVIFLGDIAMSIETIMRESDEFRVKFIDRCFHLFVHGVLHLLGMNHIDAKSEKEMEELEIYILSSFEIKNPYII